MEVDKEFLRLRADVHQMGRQLAMWTSSAIVGGMAVTASIVVAFGG